MLKYRSSKTPLFLLRFDYVSCPQLAPGFAAFCSFCDKFNNLGAKFIVGKSRQNRAEHGISGGFSFMIKVLFVCHGNICRSPMAGVCF